MVGRARLVKLNTERQKIERQIADEAIEMVTAGGHDRPENRVIVVASENWHGGVRNSYFKRDYIG